MKILCCKAEILWRSKAARTDNRPISPVITAVFPPDLDKLLFISLTSIVSKSVANSVYC